MLPAVQRTADGSSERRAARKNPESGALLIDVGDAYRRSLAVGKNKKSYYTPYATLRLYLNELDGLPDKLLYLDIDTMCRSDVSELYDTDVSCCEFAGVPDRLGKFFVNRHYCNSGVLLLNMKRIRENKLFERVRDYVASHRMFTPDQSALNKLAGSKLLLPRKFNEQSKPCGGNGDQAFLPRRALSALLPHL